MAIKINRYGDEAFRAAEIEITGNEELNEINDLTGKKTAKVKDSVKSFMVDLAHLKRKVMSFPFLPLSMFIKRILNYGILYTEECRE